MRKKLFFLCWTFYLFLSCAQKLNPAQDNGNTVTIYNRSEISGKNPYFSCSVFADQTLRGTIWSDPKTLYKDCLFLNIDKTPNDFLKNADLFLQIYPFRLKNKGFSYGSSLEIKTFEKNPEKKKKILMKSKIIDSYLIEVELELEPDYFFLDHFFELCGLNSNWEGLQFVIYERRTNQEKAVPLRTTKALLPPFFIHPELFREKKGDMLAAYHPFMNLSRELQSKPGSYYNLAEELCSDFL